MSDPRHPGITQNCPLLSEHVFQPAKCPLIPVGFRALIGEYANPVPLKDNKQDLPALAGREPMNISDRWQFANVTDTSTMPHCRVGCALSFNVDAEGRRYTADEIGKDHTERTGSFRLLLR